MQKQTPISEIDPNSSSWKSEPTIREVILLFVMSAVLFVFTILGFQNYFVTVTNFGDSAAYGTVASSIRHWDFRGLQIKQFWGYPYAAAALSLLTRIPDQSSLLLVSSISSLLSVVLAYRLWGGWIAGLFALLNFDWMQRSFLGGSEPLATALIFGAFLAVRKERYLLATMLASLTTVVRPLGIFSLVGIAIVLLQRQEYLKLLCAVVIGISIGVLYVIPLATHFGDPLATVHSYGGGGRPLFGFPFYAIIEGTILYPVPFTNLALSFGWIFLVLVGVASMLSDKPLRKYAIKNPCEIWFAAPYLISIMCYNYPVFARVSFARFAIPALPLIYFALSKWIPRDRRLLWAVALVSPVLAAASALGIRNVIHMLTIKA